jgi:hypothetical protein
MQSQIKAKPSCEICTLVRYFAVLGGNSILTFGHNLKDQEIQKREQDMTNVTLHGLLFGGPFPSSDFMMKHDVSEAS